ncbi:ribosomal-protein-alanine N-acetyltransferase [Aeromicrobium phragmitis]|uniref:[Ribosomal protein bS18]-alanine N-acetyltransferase n=1 Tax=Aeromicrobium phragmitis TaxID=2478914 RepID=A0A3L8PMN6_9ACTN|nr:ribosomal protein S18-alanine N-acetyltransferase [Aeromicrobium phragmitis]RLV56540.1 ribosomal-protein-alanine N-acetyltransferase [Aeromicrobium phragmitis]
MTVRPAVDTDLAPLVALEAACFGSEAWSEVQVREELAGDRAVLVLEAAGQAAGYASVSVVAGDAELLRIAVRPELRREGMGRALLAAGVAAARERGACRMLLEVDAGNRPAIALYAASGFAPIARRRGYYRGRDALVMEREL